MLIKPMELMELDQVIALENAVWSSQNTPAPLPVASKDKLIKSFENGRHFLVAKEKERILAVLDYGPLYPFPSGSHVVTFGIAVDSSQRRKGIGKKLIQAFLDAVKNDYQIVLIHVLSTNCPAIAFYESLSFCLEARLKQQFFLNGQYVDDLMFSFDLQNYSTA